METILNYLKKWSNITPHKAFISDNEQNWTFKEFYEESLKLSSFFLTKGIKKGDFVVIHIDKKSDHLLSYTALLNIGAISIHLYPERENEYVRFAAKHCNAKAVISNKFKDTIKDTLIINRLSYKDLEIKEIYDPYETAYIMFTSGTTSTPKAVQTTHKNILFVTNTLIDLANMQKNREREIVFMPLGSTGGLGHFHAALICGSYIRLFPGLYSNLKDKDLINLLDSVEKEKITGMLLTPGIVIKLLQNHKSRLAQAGKSLKYLLANVTPMTKKTIDDLLTTLPKVRFCTYYGSTEASRSIVNICRDNPEYSHYTGKAAQGVEIKIDNPDKNGEGEILIKGANLMKGYLHMENKGFEDGWFKSGDIGRLDNKSYYRVLGRIKDIINIDGLKLFPQEIEDILLCHEKVKDTAVCAMKDEITFNQISAVIVLDEDIDKSALADELYKLLEKKFHTDKTELYRFKIPKKIYFEKSIPRSDLGKIKRDHLSLILEKNKTPYYNKKEL